jgi:RNA polymerase sigma-70 factor (ECF subfamily)
VEAPVMTVRTRVFYARKELYAAMATEPALAQAYEALTASEPQNNRDKPASKAARESLQERE